MIKRTLTEKLKSLILCSPIAPTKKDAFLALGGHTHLTILIAFASAFIVLITSVSYAQLIEIFPSGGGGYLVASKLISPTAGQ